MSTLTDTGLHRNRAWTVQLLEREVRYNRSEAKALRAHAERLIEKAYLLDREAEYCERELAAREEVA